MTRLFLLLLLPALILSSCRRAGDLPAEEVLRRATIQSNQLQSAEYDAELQMNVRRGPVVLSGNAAIRGTLAHAGEQAAFTVTANGTLDRGGDSTTFRLSADVVRDALDTYVLLREFLTEPAAVLTQGITPMIGTWWSLPPGEKSSPIPSLTPDPRFLRAQSEVVTVFEDHGLKDLNGRDAYHYDVAIDRDRLVNLMKVLAEEQGQPFDAKKTRSELQAYDARGQLWIDAATFVVHRLEWTVTSKEQPPATRLTLRMDLRSHDSAPAVTVPSQVAPLDRDALMQRLLRLPSASGSLRFPL